MLFVGKVLFIDGPFRNNSSLKLPVPLFLGSLKRSAYGIPPHPTAYQQGRTL
jgi:hypothetical protein